MPGRRFSKGDLYHLRNNIPITGVIKKLDIPFKISEGYFRFLCPACKEFNTAVNPNTNLARCFLCRKNYNPIDIVIKVKNISFVESIDYLTGLSTANHPPSKTPPTSSKSLQAKAPCSVKEILNSTTFPLNLSSHNKLRQSALSLNDLIQKINKLEQTIKTLTSKTESLEKKISER